eukprot:Opistho-1_new@77345
MACRSEELARHCRGVRLLLGVVQLGAQQGAQAGEARAFTRGLLAQGRHGFLLVGVVLGLDRQLDVAGLAIHVHHHCGHFVAFFQHVARVFDAVTADFAGAQVTDDVFAQIDLGALGIHGLDLAGHDRALVVDRHEGGERIGVELLDAQRDTLAVDIDSQHDGFDFLALFVVAHGGFAGLVPREVRQVHQTVDAGSQAHKDAEVGDRLDRALDAVAALGVLGKFLPRVGLALLHAQADAAFVFVDLEDHDFNFVAQGHELARCHILVGPVHFGHMDQAFDAGFEFHKRAVVGDVGDLAEQTGALRVAAVHAHPRVVAHLFQAQRDTVLFGVE